jgi:5-hydroxytryptamine receptor 2
MNNWNYQSSLNTERKCTWRRLLKSSLPYTPNHVNSGTSTETELSALDTHELWLPDSSIPESTPSTMSALHQFGAEMMKLSRGLESAVFEDTNKLPKTPLKLKRYFFNRIVFECTSKLISNFLY